MLMNRMMILLFVLASAVSANPVIAELKSIRILATGGTIAGKQADTRDPGYKSGSFNVQDLIDAVPALPKIAKLQGEQIANIGSQDMNDAVWLKLAKRINDLVAQSDVDGIVITHGTDTLEETAYFLNLVIKTEKPIVLTASMRPATSISADGPMNLFQATVVASHEEAAGRGVLVVMNNHIHYAAEITKTKTVNPDAMRSPNRGLAGKCDAEFCRFFSPTLKRHTVNSALKLPKEGESLPQVDIIYSHANSGRHLIDAAVAAGAKGLVIAGVGDGNMTNAMLDAASEHRQNGIMIVRSSHVGSGDVKRNVEINDDELDFVASREANPQKARVLLQLGLLQGLDSQAIQRLFDTH